MGKSLLVSAQALIVNFKSAVTQFSGIEALHVLTPLTDNTAGLLIMASQKPNESRVNLFSKTALGNRGITEVAAQDKYMATDAAIKTFFGLVSVGDTAAAIGMPQIKLDAGGVYWDPAVSTFPTPIFTSSATEDKVSADGNHKLLNYFNITTGTFDSKPAVLTPAVVTANTTLGLTTRQWTIGGVIAAVVGFVIWDPANWIWNRKKKSKKSDK